MPEPPSPAIVLPTISAFMFGAAPQTAEPTSKSTILPMNSGLRSKVWNRAELRPAKLAFIFHPGERQYLTPVE